MTEIRRLEPGWRFCQVVAHGSTVYVAGQVAAKPVPSVKNQTQQILRSIDRLPPSLAPGQLPGRAATADVVAADAIRAAGVSRRSPRAFQAHRRADLGPARPPSSRHELPDGLNWIARHRRITGDDGNTIDEGLRDEHAIEGISMKRRQLLESFEHAIRAARGG